MGLLARIGGVGLALMVTLELSAAVQGPGDYKVGYDTDEYETRSLSLEARLGEPTDLLKVFRDPPLGLPPVPTTESNPITEEKLQLGRKLFFDRRLSLNQTQSCAMCHIPEQGFTNNELSVAVGMEGRSGRRNAPSLYNIAYAQSMFHDGRDVTLEDQVWNPFLDRNEMGNPSFSAVIEKIKVLPDYDGLFEAVFGRGPTMETVGKALASYERALVSGNSAFDRWYYGGETDALSDEARKGFELFTGKARCSACHTIGEETALFTNHDFHNTGVGIERTADKRDAYTVFVAPGVTVDVETAIINTVGEKRIADVGRYEITNNPDDRWKYKTPGLRNVALSAPYMHDGSLKTLREVIDFYNDGGVDNENLDPLIQPLQLTDAESAQLVAFLRSLTGDNVTELVLDAFAAPVGNEQADDPDWVRVLDRKIQQSNIQSQDPGGHSQAQPTD